MSVRQRLQNIGQQADDAINLVGAALLLSAWAEPGLDLAPYRRHLKTLTNDVLAYIHGDAASAELCGEAVRQVLNRRYGYAGTFEAQEQGDGAILARVVDKRRGDAVALAILYLHVLGRLDVSAEILDFPARALVRIEDANGRRLVLDPVAGGQAVDARRLRALYRAHRGGDGELDPFNLQPLSRREALVALQDQIKAFHLRHAAPEAALAALEAAILIAPETPRLWREAGLLHARLDHVGDAISALKRFLQLPGGDAHRYTASQLLQQLQARKDRTRT